MQQEKSRKAPVFWTQREETLVAIEIHRMRASEVDCTSLNGHRATTLQSQLALAQKRVLPPERRMSVNAFYYQGKKRNFNEAWYQYALSRRALYEHAEPARADAAPPPSPPSVEAPTIEQARPAANVAVAPHEESPREEEIDPEIESMLILGSLMQQFMDHVGRAITKGVRQALIELRDEEERKLRINGDHCSSLPKLPTSAREIVKRKVDVIGLLPAQRRVVEASPAARTWDIRFLPSGTEHGRADLRERVIICTKFVSHSQQNRYRQMRAEIHWANGGAMSVIQQLEQLGRLTPRGNGATH